MNIELYKPHPKQLEIHNALENQCKYTFVSIGRQFGKTVMGENQGIKWCVDNDGWRVAWISPTYKQCKKVFKEIVKALGKFPVYAKPPNHSELSLTFLNGSQFVFYSAEAYDSIRGETFDAVIGDEMAFWKPEAWDEVIKATLLVRGKKFLGLSTPRGKGQFYKLWNLHLGSDNYQSFKGTSYDNPFIARDEIDEARLSLPDHVFRQEYLAEFLDDGSTIFTNVNESIGSGSSSGELFFALDLGRADDYTVLTICNSNNQEVYCERWRHIPWSTIVSNVCDTLNRLKPKGYVECNGTQDAIYEQIKNGVRYGKGNVQPFITTTKTKPSIIEDLIVEFEKKEIVILGHDWQLGELNTFTYEYNARTRNIKYSAPPGLHDDYVMSRAMCSRARKDFTKKGKYRVI